MGEYLNPLRSLTKSWQYTLETFHDVSKDQSTVDLKCYKVRNNYSAGTLVVNIRAIRICRFADDQYQHFILGLLYGSLGLKPPDDSESGELHIYLPDDLCDPHKNSDRDIYCDLPNLASLFCASGYYDHTVTERTACGSQFDEYIGLGIYSDILLQECSSLLNLNTKHGDICNNFFKLTVKNFNLLSKSSQQLFIMYHLRWGIQSIPDILEIEYVLLMILLYLPTLTSISSTDLSTIAVYCYILYTNSEFLQLLYNNIIKASKRDYVVQNEVKVLYISLLMLRSLQWIRIDGLFLDTDAHTGISGFKSINISKDAIATRKYAIQLLLKLWFFQPGQSIQNVSSESTHTEPSASSQDAPPESIQKVFPETTENVLPESQEHTDSKSNSSHVTMMPELSNSNFFNNEPTCFTAGPLECGASENTTHTKESRADNQIYVFRTVAALCLGRDLVFALSDIGRVSEVKAVFESLLQPCSQEILGTIYKVSSLQIIAPEKSFDKFLYFFSKSITESGLNMIETQNLFLTDQFKHICKFKGLPSLSSEFKPSLLLCLLSIQPNVMARSFPLDVLDFLTSRFFEQEVCKDNAVRQFSWNFDTRRSLKPFLNIPDLILYINNYSSSLTSSNVFGLSKIDYLEQLLIVSQYSVLSPPGTLQARCLRSCFLDIFFSNYTLPLYLFDFLSMTAQAIEDSKESIPTDNSTTEYERFNAISKYLVPSDCNEIYLSVFQSEKSYLEKIPLWCIYNVYRRICYDASDLGFFSAVCTQAKPNYLILDLIWKHICDIETVKVAIIPPILCTSLMYMSSFLQSYMKILGKTCYVSLILGFIEYTVQQLYCNNLFPAFSNEEHQEFLSNPLNSEYFNNYYISLCTDTLVGKLLILSGFEPQVMFFEMTGNPCRSVYCLEEISELKPYFLFDSVLTKFYENYAHLVPLFTNQTPISDDLFRVLLNAFYIIYLQTPVLYPLANFLNRTCNIQ